MKIEYTVSRDEALQVATEFLKTRRPSRNKKRVIILLCILVAAAFALEEPATFTLDETPSPLPSLLLTLFVQIPLCALLVGLLLKLLAGVFGSFSERVLRKTIDDQPSEHWGRRVLSFGDGKITLDTDIASQTLVARLVDSIVTTEHAYHLVHNGKPVFQVPKKACDFQQFSEALNGEKGVRIGSP